MTDTKVDLMKVALYAFLYVNSIDLDKITFKLESNSIGFHRLYKNTGTAKVICPIMSTRIGISVDVTYSKDIILQGQAKTYIG